MRSNIPVIVTDSSVDMQMHRIICWTVIFLMVTQPAWAATYYVRKDGSAGNKAAATSCSATTTAMSVATHDGQTFSPGDTVCFCTEGGTYTVVGDRVDFPSSGTSDSLIYLDGDCDGDGVKATWDFNGAATFWTMTADGKSYLDISNISLEDNNQSGLRLIDAHHIYVHHNTLNYFPEAGLRLNTSAGNSTHDIWVYSNVMNYNKYGALTSTPNASSPIYNVYFGVDENNNKKPNTITYSGTAGVKFSGTHYNSIIWYDDIGYSGSTGVGLEWGTGIEIAGSATNFPYDNIVQFANVHHTVDYDADGTDGVGIRQDDYARNTTIRYNNVHDNEGNAIDLSNKHGYGGTAHNNILTNNNTGSAAWPSQENAGIVVNDGTAVGTASSVHNNTIYGGDRCVYVYQSFATVSIKNNICSGQAAEGMLLEKTLFDAGGYSIENNDIFNPGTYALATLQAYVAVADQTSSLSATNITTDPLFINPSAGDFCLDNNSPAIRAGTGQACDMGAYKTTPGLIGSSLWFGNLPLGSDDAVCTIQ